MPNTTNFDIAGKRRDDKERVVDTIKPESALEENIIKDPEFIEGTLWGKPRRGHPEGEVLAHIEEVLANVNKFVFNDGFNDGYERMALRMIAIIHDTFKYKVDPTRSKTGENHHAMIARRFAEKYMPTNIYDTKILDIIELHDEAYNSWRKGAIKSKWSSAEQRAKKLIERLEKANALRLYMKFYKCDGLTGDKSNEPLIWFNKMIKKYARNPI